MKHLIVDQKGVYCRPMGAAWLKRTFPLIQVAEAMLHLIFETVKVYYGMT